MLHSSIEVLGRITEAKKAVKSNVFRQIYIKTWKKRAKIVN